MEKKVVIKPVIFRGLIWGSPGKPGGAPLREVKPEEVTEYYKNAIKRAEVKEAFLIDTPKEAAKLKDQVGEVDILLVHRPELLSVTWAVKALETLEIPVALYGFENHPGAVICDIYGYLKSTGKRNVFLALNLSDIEKLTSAVIAKKMLNSANILIIGDGFPSWSQVANPTSPDDVTKKLGTKVSQASIEELFERIYRVSLQDAEKLAAQLIDNALEVKPEAMNTLMEAAMTHIAIEELVCEQGANGVAVDCRLMDEISMERHGVFYSPCLSLTLLRAKGIHAACEADVCALLSMMIMGYLANKPTFMGNIGTANPKEGWIEIAHCAATVNMDGYDSPQEPLSLLDYHNRGTGVATFSRMREGQIVTFARLGKDLKTFGVGCGEILDSSPAKGCVNRIRIKLDNVRDFLYRCMLGDHHAVVYGDITEESKLLCDLLGIEFVVAF